MHRNRECDTWWMQSNSIALRLHATSFSVYFQLMTWEFQANVVIIQAYFLSDANIALQIMRIFVGITLKFRLIDTALSCPNWHFTLTSVRLSNHLIQHECAQPTSHVGIISGFCSFDTAFKVLKKCTFSRLFILKRWSVWRSRTRRRRRLRKPKARSLWNRICSEWFNTAIVSSPGIASGEFFIQRIKKWKVTDRNSIFWIWTRDDRIEIKK